MKFFTKYPKFTVSFIDYLVLEVLKKHLLILVNKFLYLNIFSLAKKAANQFIVLFFYFITRKFGLRNIAINRPSDFRNS